MFCCFVLFFAISTCIWEFVAFHLQNWHLVEPICLKRLICLRSAFHSPKFLFSCSDSYWWRLVPSVIHPWHLKHWEIQLTLLLLFTICLFIITFSQLSCVDEKVTSGIYNSLCCFLLDLLQSKYFYETPTVCLPSEEVALYTAGRTDR